MTSFKSNFRQRTRPLLMAMMLGTAAAVAPMGSAFAADPVNINSADAKTLAAAINGVGMKRAKAIVAHRDAHGPFASVDGLSQVPGIGAKTVSQNRSRLTVR